MDADSFLHEYFQLVFSSITSNNGSALAKQLTIDMSMATSIGSLISNVSLYITNVYLYLHTQCFFF